MSRVLLSSIALLFVACTGGSDPDDPTDTKDKTGLSEGPYCEATETEVTLDEVTDLGFAAQVIVDLATGEHLSTMIWQDDSTTDLTVTTTLDGRVLFVHEEAVYPTGTGEAPAIAVVCEDHVAIEGSVQITTADGLLDEMVDVSFRSWEGVMVESWGELDPGALTGTLVFDDFHSEPEYDARSLHVLMRFDASGASGEVAGSVQGGGDCVDGEVCTAWSGMVQIGTWGDEGM